MPQKLTKAQKEVVEREALRLYDKYNPAPELEIKVSKQECLDQAKRRLKRRAKVNC